MTDVTPLIPAGRQVVDSYGRNGFHVSGVAYAGAILVTAEATVAWPVGALDAITPDSFSALFDRGIEILLLGCGPRMVPVPPALRAALKAKGIVVDAMDTGAACRTYNVLVAEERHVAAALLPAG
ncbi:MAG: Mth938-like domain-containing protein [Alphaproteobacteria bacterium]|nr:Mth938-like domain-containing protein [Alphaproteobacteria bacterium]